MYDVIIIRIYSISRQDLEFIFIFLVDSHMKQMQDVHRQGKQNSLFQNYSPCGEKQQKSDSEKSNQIRHIQFSSNIKLMSPLEKDSMECKGFSTPIQIAQFQQNKIHFQQQHAQDSSPLMLIQISGDIKKIAEKQNQESEDSELEREFEDQQSHQIEVDAVIDLMGNKICQFNVCSNLNDEDEGELSPIIQDKENNIPEKYLIMNTPLKMRPLQLRSPLQDITPSMTHKKKGEGFNTKTNKKNKTSNKTASKIFGFEMQKWGLLTPRTMAESRLNKSKASNVNKSTLRVERF